MYKYLVNCNIMQRNAAAVLTILCILLCLTFNYTFPLHRGGINVFVDVYDNRSRICSRSDHHENHKMANDAFKRLDAKQDLSRNAKAHWNDKNDLSEEDLRQYEQLVIMKKYPYLDLKEIELKYNSPSDKNTRQSGKYDAGSSYVGDPSFCESFEDVPNVEIINRGLTGFAIPAKIIKSSKLLENKLKLNNFKEYLDSGTKHNIKLAMNSAPREAESLRNDIVDYEEKKNE